MRGRRDRVLPTEGLRRPQGWRMRGVLLLMGVSVAAHALPGSRICTSTAADHQCTGLQPSAEAACIAYIPLFAATTVFDPPWELAGVHSSTPNGHGCAMDFVIHNTATDQTIPDDSISESGFYESYDVGDRYLDAPGTCPAVGDPIYPLTGVSTEEIVTGLRVGGEALVLTYDTRRQLPQTAGDVPWLASPQPSFGAMWTSNFHKSLVAEAAYASMGGDYSNVVMHRGGARVASAGPAGHVDTCGSNTGGPDPGTGAPTFNSATIRGLHVVFSGPVDTAPATLNDERAATQESYRGDGRVSAVAAAAGGTLQYTYSDVASADAPVTGLLTRITDANGRWLDFKYEQPSPGGPVHVRHVDASSGEFVDFAYDGVDNLARVTWSDATFQQFLYEDPAHVWALTGVRDEAGQRYASFAYDASGRATLSELGSHEAMKVSGSYGADLASGPHWQVAESVTSPGMMCRIHSWVGPGQQDMTVAGQPVTFATANVNGMPRAASQSRPAGSGCAASSSDQDFDADGNVTRRDDFNGNRSCMAYDLSRGLETVRLEGLPGRGSPVPKACPADVAGYVPVVDPGSAYPERKISTQWHPDWALPVGRAEPLKLTTWTYNGHGASCVPASATLPDGKPLAVVCARTEQATKDATGGAGFAATSSGPARTWRYTYDALAHVLTETPPRSTGGRAHATTYAYYAHTSFPDGVSGHTLGDLRTVTNALGQVTQFTSYDKAGRLLSSVEANGTVTTRSYGPRGWLHTVTLQPADGPAETTTYDYGPTGLLHVATLPDATTLTYTYEDAHRLTDVADNLGNTVHYVLDSQGNRIDEQRHDASGRLGAEVTRVFDALNRLQTTTR